MIKLILRGSLFPLHSIFYKFQRNRNAKKMMNYYLGIKNQAIILYRYWTFITLAAMSAWINLHWTKYQRALLVIENKSITIMENRIYTQRNCPRKVYFESISSCIITMVYYKFVYIPSQDGIIHDNRCWALYCWRSHIYFRYSYII